MGTSARSATAEYVEQAKQLEKLGWTFKPTTSGGIIQNPDGESAGLHTSGGSDPRSIRNLRADLTRIGFFDACQQLQQDKRASGQAATVAARKRTATIEAVIKPAAAASFFSASSDDTARPSSVRGMMMRLENISPERAEELLARGMSVTLADGTQLHQRRILDNDVTKFVQIIEHGQWLDMPDGISFAPDGTLLNGRHRLTAVIRSGQTLPFHVHYNVPPEYFAAFDTSRTRTAADTLTMAGCINPNQLASALKLQVLLDRSLTDPDQVPHWTRWATVKLTNRDVYDAAMHYPEMGQHVRSGQNLMNGCGLSAPASAVFLHSSIRAWPSGRELITDFQIALQTGEGLRRGDPAYELREWVRRHPIGVRPKREVHLLLLFKVAGYALRGKSLRGIPRYDESQAMGEPYAPRRLRAAS